MQQGLAVLVCHIRVQLQPQHPLEHLGLLQILPGELGDDCDQKRRPNQLAPVIGTLSKHHFDNGHVSPDGSEL